MASSTTSGGVGLDTIIALFLSWTTWKSVGWAIIHGILGWFYVIFWRQNQNLFRRIKPCFNVMRVNGRGAEPERWLNAKVTLNPNGYSPTHSVRSYSTNQQRARRQR